MGINDSDKKNNHHIHTDHQRSTFMPMLCGSSTRGVKLPKWHARSSSSIADPSSPRVSCIGQVKRNSRVTGFSTPPPHSFTTSGTKQQRTKYMKLKKMFSGNNLTAVMPAAAASTTGSTHSCDYRSRGRSCRRSAGNGDPTPVDVSDLDPPLPVIKPVDHIGSRPNEVSLWRRRSNGSISLKNLEIQPIHIPNGHYSIQFRNNRTSRV